MFSNMPVLQIGREIVVSSGLVGGVLMVFSCCYVFYFVSSIIIKSVVGGKRGIFQTVEEFFGKRGAIVCVALVICVFCMWFVIQFRFLKDSLFLFYSRPELSQLAVFQSFLLYLLCVSLVVASHYSFLICSAVSTVGNVLSIIYIAYTFFMSIRLQDVRLYTNSFDLHMALPLLNNLLTTVFAVPIFYKSNVVYKNTKLNLKLVYFVFLPFLVVLGMIFGFLSPDGPDFMHFCLNHPKIPRAIILTYLLSSMCFINMLNLYLSSGFVTYITKVEGRVLPIALVVLLCIGLFFIQNLESVLHFFIASIATMVSMIVTKSAIKQYQDNSEFRRNNIISLFISTIILFFCKMNWIKITGLLFFDAVIIALLFSVHAYRADEAKAEQ
jgi:hypothetical protein